LESPSPTEHQKDHTHMFTCKIASNARGQAVETPLPEERLQHSTAFAVTGLDFAGPLFTKKDQSANS